MRRFSVSLMALVMLAMAQASCSRERDLFADVEVRDSSRQIGGIALSAICARSSVEETGSSGAEM